MAVGDGQIYVDYGQVNNVYEALEDADNAIQRVLNQLQDTISTLQGSWSGESESQYQVVQARWNNDMSQMNSTRASSRATLDEMAINYGTTDNDLALQWNAIH